MSDLASITISEEEEPIFVDVVENAEQLRKLKKSQEKEKQSSRKSSRSKASSGSHKHKHHHSEDKFSKTLNEKALANLQESMSFYTFDTLSVHHLPSSKHSHSNKKYTQSLRGRSENFSDDSSIVQTLSDDDSSGASSVIIQGPDGEFYEYDSIMLFFYL